MEQTKVQTGDGSGFTEQTNHYSSPVIIINRYVKEDFFGHQGVVTYCLKVSRVLLGNQKSYLLTFEKEEKLKKTKKQIIDLNPIFKSLS